MQRSGLAFNISRKNISILSMYTILGLLPTSITGQSVVFCDLFSFLLKPFLTYNFLFLKLALHQFFFYSKRLICSSFSIYWFIFSVNTFQKRPKKNEFRKSFWQIKCSYRIHARIPMDFCADKIQDLLTLTHALLIDCKMQRRASYQRVRLAPLDVRVPSAVPSLRLQWAVFHTGFTINSSILLVTK